MDSKHKMRRVNNPVIKLNRLGERTGVTEVQIGQQNFIKLILVS